MTTNFDDEGLSTSSSSSSDEEEENQEKIAVHEEDSKNTKGKKSKPSHTSVGTTMLFDKYGHYTGGRILVSHDCKNRWTQETVHALRNTLVDFITTKSKALRPLVQSGQSVEISVPHTSNDCIRFTIRPFFARMDSSLILRIEREVTKHLPGFTFYIGQQESKSKNVHLLPSGGGSPFSVTVPNESAQPYFEFRPISLRDPSYLITIAIMLFVLILAFVYNFYGTYAGQGYSLSAAVHEVLTALSIL